MSDKSIRSTLDPDDPPELAPEEQTRLDAMTDEEAHQNAQEDPDNPPMGEEEQGTFRRIPNVREIRLRLGMSQSEFSGAFGIPVSVVRDWEQLRSFPNQAARSYLHVIASIPSEVRSALKAS